MEQNSMIYIWGLFAAMIAIVLGQFLFSRRRKLKFLQSVSQGLDAEIKSRLGDPYLEIRGDGKSCRLLIKQRPVIIILERENSLGFKFTVDEKRSLEAKLRIDGLRTMEIGNPVIDQQITFRTNDENKARALFLKEGCFPAIQGLMANGFRTIIASRDKITATKVVGIFSRESLSPQQLKQLATNLAGIDF